MSSLEDWTQLLSSCSTPALLVSQYHANELRVSVEETGIYRYKSWLPVQRNLIGFSRSITYQSKRLSALTGLKKLWIAFDGYWPQRGDHCLPEPFRELEAHFLLRRLPIEDENVLVLGFAGNT